MRSNSCLVFDEIFDFAQKILPGRFAGAENMIAAIECDIHCVRHFGHTEKAGEKCGLGRIFAVHVLDLDQARVDQQK